MRPMMFFTAVWGGTWMGASAALAYPTNYATASAGARLTTEAQLRAGCDLAQLASEKPDEPGECDFADVTQHEWFLLDLGQERAFDRIALGFGNLGSPRAPQRLVVKGSTTGPEGPWQTLLDVGDVGFAQTYRLAPTTARWLLFDLGDNADGHGSHLWGLAVFQSPPWLTAAERMSAFHAAFRRDAPGLEGFWTQVEQGNWTEAARALRRHYARLAPTEPKVPTYDVARAQAVRDRVFDLAGRTHRFTGDVDWGYMPTTDWYEWKNFLNRGSPLLRPALAYYHTGQREWARLSEEITRDWLVNNPRPPFTRHASFPTWRTLDTAIRYGYLVSLLGIMAAAPEEDFSLDGWLNLLYSIWEHCDYLKDDRESGGNWLALISEAVLDGGLKFPEFRDSGQWLEMGRAAFERNVLRDVYPDGKEMEDAPGYVCFAYNHWLETLFALDRAGVAVQPEVRERLDRVQDFLGWVTQPDGNMPAIGDWGGGPAYPLPKSGPYFQREDVRYILTQGKEGQRPAITSRHFPQGGWSILRSDWDEAHFDQARHLVFKSSHGPHGHLDVLSLTLYAYGRALLIDPGIRSYEAADAKFASTPYHNTVTLDGQNQAPQSGATTQWWTTRSFDFVRGEHHNYPAVTHCREVCFVKPDYFLVHDALSGEGEHTAEQSWHFPPDAAPQERGPEAPGAVTTTFPTGGNLWLLPGAGGMEGEEITFDVAVERMTGAAAVSAKGWKYVQRGALPLTFDTVLYPYAEGTKPQPSVARLAEDHGRPPHEVTALRVSVGEAADTFLSDRRAGPETPRRAGPEASPSLSFDRGQLQFDGQLLLLRERGGQVVKFAVAGGTQFAYRGVTWFASERPLALLEVEYAEATVQVICPESVPALTLFTAGRKLLALNGGAPQTVAEEQVRLGGQP